MLKPELAERIKVFAAGADAALLQETLDLALGAAAGEKDAEEQLEDAFGRELEFGTGGLRGLMGPGTNRMNRVTVARATQGLANYILQAGVVKPPAVCIAHDSRNRSPEFAREAAQVLAGNGIKVWLFSGLRPTPELSFAVRQLKASAGIVVTASHNPKEYNGYKVSWDDGGQVLPPHDKAIVAEVGKISGLDQVRRVKFDKAVEDEMIVLIDKEIDKAYLEALDAICFRPELCRSHGGDLKIVYTPLHGTGIRVVPEALARWGFTSVEVVDQQAQPDGNFPTVKSPNPEEKAALELAIALATKINADVVMATDPDADRIGIAVKHEGQFELISGNQVGALMAYYVCETLKEQNRLSANGVLIKTIVTTELITAIAKDYGVGIENCLTGFKYIAQVIRGYEINATDGAPASTFLMGCEESYGYLVGTHARDKDAVVSACVLAEMALWAQRDGKSLIDVLNDLYMKYGVHRETQLSKTMPGMSGMKQIQALMENLRQNPPREIAGIPVRMITDIQSGKRVDPTTGQESPGPDLAKSNVLIFDLSDGSVVVARPSGTEPKVKFYFMVVDKDGAPFADRDLLSEKLAACEKKEQSIREAFAKLAS